MPRSATFLARAGMRMVMARLLASLKSAISLAPLRSSPGPSMLDVTSITIGRRSRTLPPRQSSTSPAANLARSASSKPAASVSLLWARAGAAAAVAVADAAARNLRRVVRMAAVSAPAAAAASDRVVAGGRAGREQTGGRIVPKRMARFLRFLAWTAGILVVLVVVAIGTVYFYVTSDDFRGRIESHASTLAGRKTTIADISIDWGFDVARPSERRSVRQCRVGQGTPHAQGRAGRFRDPPVAAAQGRPGAAEPGPAQARDRDREGRQGSAELGAGRGAGRCRGGQAGGRARQPLRDAADRPPRSHRRQAQLPRSQAQARARRHGLDGDGQGRRPAAGRAAAQGQARGPAAHPALRRRLDRHAARHRAALSARPRRHLRRHQAQGQGHGAWIPSSGPAPTSQLSLSGHDLADIYPLLGIPGPPTPPYNISGKLHRESGVWKFVQSKWHVGDSDLTGDVLVDSAAQARASHGQARLAEAGLRRPGAAGRRAARQARRQRLAPAAPDPAAARGHGRSLPQRAAQGREAAGHEHGRHARCQAGGRARLPAGAGACPSGSWCRTAWRRPSRSP